MQDMLLFQWYLPLSASPFTETENDNLIFICKSSLDVNTILHKSNHLFVQKAYSQVYRSRRKEKTGKSMPDSSIMLELCEILGITVNELLSGEKINMESYEKRQMKI